MYQDNVGMGNKRSADPPETDGDGSQDAPSSRKKVKVEPAFDLEFRYMYNPTDDFEPEKASNSAYMMEDGKNNTDEEMSSSHDCHDEFPTFPPVHGPSARPHSMVIARAYSESLVREQQMAPRLQSWSSIPNLNNPYAFRGYPLMPARPESLIWEQRNAPRYFPRSSARVPNHPYAFQGYRLMPAPPRTCTTAQPTHADPTTAAGSSSSSQYYSDAFP